MNRIDAINDDSAGSPGDALAQYSYLGSGSIVQVDYPEPDLRYDLAHGAGDDPYDGPMDRFGRVTDLLWRDYGSATDAVRIRHGYDRASNRLWREDPVAAANGKDFDEFYTYDGMYQLKSLDRGDLNAGKTAITGTPDWEEDWSLDPTGNWTDYLQKTSGSTDLDQSRAHNRANEITDIAETVGDMWITPTHDRNGNMLRIMKPDDPETYYTLTWDAWNRLVKVEDGATPIANYAYDGRNFRTTKLVSGTTRHFYYNNEWQCLEERLDNSSNADRHFLWGLRYVDDLVLRDRDTSDPADGTLDERLYALQDPNWNVTAIASTDGPIQERDAYDAYGKPTVLTGTFGSRAESTWDWKTRFAGLYADTETGWYEVRNRSLLHGLGRWNRRDPAELEGDHLNPFRYVENNPTGHTDPSGLAGLPEGVGVHCRCARGIPNPFGAVGMWGQPGSRATGLCYDIPEGCGSRVEITGGNVCNTILGAFSPSSGALKLYLTKPSRSQDGWWEVDYEWFVMLISTVGTRPVARIRLSCLD